MDGVCEGVLCDEWCVSEGVLCDGCCVSEGVLCEKCCVMSDVWSCFYLQCSGCLGPLCQ